MNKARILLIIGTWTAILPYLGFPSVLKNLLFTLTGAFIAYISYTFYLENKKNTKKEDKAFDNFSENKDFEKEEKLEDNKIEI